jgi:hypothetical protein
MSFCLYKPPAYGSVLFAVLLAGAPFLRAEDFAISTQVFEGGRPDPLAENLTVFQANRIYDFALTPPQRGTMFDAAARLFRLTDESSQTQSTLTVEELLQFVAAEQTRARESRNPLVRFAAAPSFSEKFDPTSGQLELRSPFWDYEVATMAAPDSDRSQQYQLFAHWYTHLNALFRPLPPGVRIRLNERLAEHARLPVRVVARVKQEGKVVVEQESRHQMIWSLTDRERQEVQQCEAQLATYRQVAFREFVGAHH